MNPIISIKNIGKKYAVTHGGARYETMREQLVQYIKHPFKRKETQETFWALKNISCDIYKGDVVGIIGKNGAGKSTLLKILSRITVPTEGTVHMHGRVSSLLEVGTGFHPELTGRENIFLNGAILGMSGKEIQDKWNDIVSFAGVEQFIDTPVKHYSSGMHMRLAFSVAAHLDPDILIVDEVLAVGDGEFQKKCLGRIEEISKEKHRTVLVVSHNLDVIESICNKVILLEKGEVKKVGTASEVIDTYLEQAQNTDIQENDTRKSAVIASVKIKNNKNTSLSISEPFTITVQFHVNTRIDMAVLCFLFKADGRILYAATEGDSTGTTKTYEPGTYTSTITIPAFFFNVGLYRLDVNIQRPGIEYFASIEGISFRIISTDNPRDDLFGGKVHGHMAAILGISTKKHETNT